LNVYSNWAHPKIKEQWAWANQGLIGITQDGSDPDKTQWQAFANAVQNGTPLFREWSGRNYSWPKGSPILMDLEPLWFHPKRSMSERYNWHCRVAAWIKSVYPGVRLMSYSGLDLDTMHAKPFVDQLWAICPGDYFGTKLNTSEKQSILDAERDKILSYRQAYPNKRLIWFTKSSFASEWSDTLPDETPEQKEARMYSMEPHFDDIYDAIYLHIDGIFVWEQDPNGITPATDRMIRKFANP
jgi:hypothetical protein